MTDQDSRIDAALSAEERRLLAQFDDEPPFIDQALGLFGGRNGWVSVITMIAQAGLFVGGVWAGWRFFGAGDALEAIRWGLPAAVMLLMSLSIKLAMWPMMYIHRLRQDVGHLARQLDDRAG